MEVVSAAAGATSQTWRSSTVLRWLSLRVIIIMPFRHAHLQLFRKSHAHALDRASGDVESTRARV